MTAHDRYLAGYSTFPAELECQDCGTRFDGRVTSEYGTSWTEPEECPHCQSTAIDAEPMSDYDIQERIYEARGEDF